MHVCVCLCTCACVECVGVGVCTCACMHTLMWRSLNDLKKLVLSFHGSRDQIQVAEPSLEPQVQGFFVF